MIPPEHLTHFKIKNNMNELILLAEKHPSLNITIGLAVLIEFGKFMVAETKRQIEQTLTDASEEKYLSPVKTAELLDVDVSTLWRWNKRNYLTPAELGGKRKYKMSEIQRILNGGK